jgi:hypothetical protein
MANAGKSAGVIAMSFAIALISSEPKSQIYLVLAGSH